MSGLSREHQRAALARRHLAEQLRGSQEGAVYVELCLKIPGLLQSQGLSGTLHTLASNSGASGRCLLAHLAEQLQLPNSDALVAQIGSADVAETIAMSREIRRCLVWYRRLAETATPGDVSERA